MTKPVLRWDFGARSPADQLAMRIASLLVGQVQRAPDMGSRGNVKHFTAGELGWCREDREALGDTRYREFEKWEHKVSINSEEWDSYC